MMKKIVFLGTTVLLLVFLLLDPSAASKASADGLMLWFRSLVPVLLPFFVLSGLLIALDGISAVIFWLYPALHRVFGCSRNGCFCIAAGFLCGYPVGAKLTGDLVRERRITCEEGNYLLGFCNNVSPAFLLGYCLTESLNRPDLTALTLGLVYGVPVSLALIARRGRSFESPVTEKKTSGFQISFKIVDACMMNGLESILKLGCYMILFSMLARLLMKFPCPLSYVSYGSIGLLELTNGIALVSSDRSVPALHKYIFLLVFVTFGGLSGAAQTDSMLQGSGLSLKHYLKEKLLSALIVACLAIFFHSLKNYIL